jgi:hypothetical protein
MADDLDRIALTVRWRKDMTLAVRLSMTSAFPGEGASMYGHDPVWRLPMSAFEWTRFDSGAGSSGITVADTLSFAPGADVQLTTVDFSGRKLHDATSGPLDDNAVATLSWSPSTTTIGLSETWNTVKNIEITAIDTKGLTVRDFVDVRVDLDGKDNYSLDIVNAKRGVLMTDGGDDRITVGYASNEYQWSNAFRIATGAGNDTVRVRPQDDAALPQSKWSVAFNAHPEQTQARIDLGDGNDKAELSGCSGMVFGDAGNDTIRLSGGNVSAFGGAGRDLIIAAVGKDGSGISTVDGGAGRDTIMVYDGSQGGDFHVTVAVHKGETGHSVGTADEVWFGQQRGDGGFQAGGPSMLSFDLYGYSAGSTAELVHRGVQTLLSIHDAGDNDIDMIKLVGQPVSSVDDLHVQFVST